MQVACRVAHVKNETINLTIVQVECAGVDGVLGLLAHELGYRLVTGVPGVEEELATLILPIYYLDIVGTSTHAPSYPYYP